MDDASARVASDLSASETHGVATALGLASFHRVLINSDDYQRGAKNGSFIRDDTGTYRRVTLRQWLDLNYTFAEVHPPEHVEVY